MATATAAKEISTKYIDVILYDCALLTPPLEVFPGRYYIAGGYINCDAAIQAFPSGTPPENPVQGAVYFDTALNKMCVYHDDQWVEIASIYY